VFLEVANDDHAEAEFDARALDVWFPPSPPRRAEWALSAPGLRVGYLAFQTEREPFSRKRIRQAVAAALDPGVIGGAAPVVPAIRRLGTPRGEPAPRRFTGQREEVARRRRMAVGIQVDARCRR